MAYNKGLKFSTVKRGLEDTIENTQLVTCIVGDAGIGKSQLVRRVAAEKGYFYRELTCSLMQEGDLAFPRIQNDRVVYVLNEAIVDIIQFCEQNPDKGAVLFLDEFNRSSAQVQAELMNLVLQRQVMGTTLPEHCYLVLAMNPSNDIEGFENSEYATTAGDAAINDRTMRIRMRADLDDWLENFASEEVNGRPRIYQGVRDFLTEEGEEAFLVVDSAHDKNPTPRGYERVSTFIYQLLDAGYSLTDPDIQPYLLEGIQGSIGEHYGEALFERITNDYGFITPETFLAQDGDSNTPEILKIFDEVEEIRRETIIFGLAQAIVADEAARTDIAVGRRFTELADRLNKDTLAALVHRLMTAQYDEDNPARADYEEWLETLFQAGDDGASQTGFYELAAPIINSSLR